MNRARDREAAVRACRVGRATASDGSRGRVLCPWESPTRSQAQHNIDRVNVDEINVDERRRRADDAMVDDARTIYCSASEWFLQIAAAIPPGSLSAGAVPGWTVLQLLAHANRSHVLVVDYVERPVDPSTVPADYASPANIERRAGEAVRDLGEDPFGAVQADAVRARRLLATAAADCPVGTPFGRMTLDEYLPSRTAELVLHGVDLARATGQSPAMPPDAARAVAQFLLGRAIAQGRAADIALALSGRGALPTGFSVY